MAVVYLLGPGMWDFEKKTAGASPSPLDIRRDIARRFRSAGHEVILMEDQPDQEGEDMIQKFTRLLYNKVTDVMFYWPARAKMQTTYDEMLMLSLRKALLHRRRISIWILHHISVAKITRDEFKILETGGRSRYLTALTRLGAYVLEWDTEEEFDQQISLLILQLTK